MPQDDVINRSTLMQATADILMALRRFSEAADNYNEALRLNAGNVTAQYNKGLALYRAGRYQEAAATYAHIQQLDPTNSDAWLFGADALWRLGNYVEAVSAYQRAFDLDPRSLKDMAKPVRTVIRRMG